MPYVLNQADGFQSVVQIDQKSLIEFKARYFVPLEAALDKNGILLNIQDSWSCLLHF